MLHIAIQIRDLVTSNVSTMVDAASDPAKMLRQFRREIEEAIITLSGDASRSRSHDQRLAADAVGLEKTGAEWADRAALAMQNEREDLARGALLEREAALDAIAARKIEIAANQAELAELTEAIAGLEAKLAEVRAQLSALEQADTAAGRSAAGRASKTEHQLDRIATLEQRLKFASDAKGASSPSVEAEIEAMRLDRTINAQLDALRAKTAKNRKK